MVSGRMPSRIHQALRRVSRARPMRPRRLMPVLECANDGGGDSQMTPVAIPLRLLRLRLVFCLVGGDAPDAPTGAGATPSRRAWYGRGAVGVFMRLSPPLGVACLFHSWGCPLDLQDRVAGRPGLLGTRGGERREPERVPNSDGGRTAGSLGRKGPRGSLVATVLPDVLNGYTSIEARMTSTREGENT